MFITLLFFFNASFVIILQTVKKDILDEMITAGRTNGLKSFEQVTLLHFAFFSHSDYNI